jgi:hypothetical protein
VAEKSDFDKQMEMARDYVKEYHEELRQQKAKEERRERNRKKYAHERDEGILTFAYKEIMSFLKA